MPKSVIFKVNVSMAGDGTFSIPLPEDAMVLKFDYDLSGQLCGWVEIPDSSKTKIMPTRNFHAVQTGQEFEHEGTYIGTVLQKLHSDHSFQFHTPYFPGLEFHIYELTS